MTGGQLEPRLHKPPDRWPAEAFERLIDALAAALVASYRRREDDGEAVAEAPRG